jgi:tyrosyl-tRNA synthetase
MDNQIDSNLDEILENIINDSNYNEVPLKDSIKNFLDTNKSINILWGVQPRLTPTLEFLIPIIQIMKFLKHGFTVTILLADIHELLDSPNLSLDIIKHRCEAYKELISQLIEIFDINPGNIIFKYGSEFQTSPNYTMDIYKISSFTSIKDTYKSREIDISDIDISINSSDKKMTNMLYPILQALDEKYTDCDAFYGSITQKNMCRFSRNIMKNFRNNDKNIMYMLQDLTKKIDISFFDPNDTVKNKLNDYSIDDIYYLSEHILFPILYYKSDKMIINNSEIDNYQHFKNYIYSKNLEKDKIIEIVSEILSKHLDKFYFNLISSRFMNYFQKGWIGISYD